MKKNRIFKTISGAALCTALLTGCSESWLEPKPLSFLTPENAYVDADGLLTSLAAAERSMRHEYFKEDYKILNTEVDILVNLSSPTSASAERLIKQAPCRIWIAN